MGTAVVSTLLCLAPPKTLLWAFLALGESITGVGLLDLVISGGGVFRTLRGMRLRGRPVPARSASAAC